MRSLPYFLSLIFVFSSLFAAAQGQTCASAVQINNLPYATGFFRTENTCGAGNNYTSQNRCGNRYMNDEEFMYAYTPVNDICVTATVSPSGGALSGTSAALFVTKSCPDDPNGQCIAQEINYNADGAEVTATGIALTAGFTYYFQVTAQAECYSFKFSLEEAAGACSTKPTGYNCDLAENISNLPYTTNANASNCNTESILKEGNECYSTTYNDSPSYIYKFKPNRDMCVKFEGRTTNTTMRFSIHDTCPTFSDESCQRSFYFYTFGVYTYYETLDSGKTYYFTVGSGAACSDYNFTFSEISNEGATCQNPYFVTPNAAGTFELPQLTTRCKGDDYQEERVCLNSTYYHSGNDVVFKYESPGDECISAGAVNVNGYYLSFSMFKGCPSPTNTTRLADACYNANTRSAEIEYTITDPGTYYFIVSGYAYQFSATSTKTYYDRDFDFRFSRALIENLGKDCDYADVMTVGANNFSRKEGISVQCKNNDYSAADACGNTLIDGSDYVLTYTATESFCGTVVGKNVFGTGGIMLFDDCPGPSTNCLGATACEVGCDSIYVDFRFEKGKTYYIVGAASSGNYFGFDLEVRKSYNTEDGCPECEGECDDCINSNFEKGSFINWTGFTGIYGTPKQVAGLDTTYINDPNSRHTLMNAGGYDPVVGEDKLKTTGPLGERYAVRIGNRKTGAQADVLSYAFTVTPETKNFFYYYAVVFEDPNHTAAQQPFFSVNMVAIDGNGSETDLGCAKYEVRADPSDPTFTETFNHITQTGTIRWKDWTLVTVPLDNFMGQDVRIEFTSKDCDQSGHFGYAYVDAFCGDIQLESNTDKYAICPGEDLTLTAPDGFAKYTWSTGETTKSIIVNQAGTYSVELEPFSDIPNPSCFVTLQQEVFVSEDPTADYTFDDGCIDQFIDFTNTSTGSNEFPLESYRWNFDDGSGTFPDTNRTHAFPGPGTYNVQLITTNTGGCKDTSVQEIIIPEYPKLAPINALDLIQICQFDSAQLQADDLGNVTYNWSGPNGYSSSEQKPYVTFSDTSMRGEYIIEVISNDDPCLSAYDTTLVEIVPFPEYSLTPDTSLCFNDRSLTLLATGGTSYAWSPAAIFNDATLQTPIANPDSTTEITVNTMHPLCPDSTMVMLLTIDYYQELLDIPTQIVLCQNDSLQIDILSGAPLDFIQWQSPDSIIFNDSTIIRPQLTDSLAGYYYLKSYLGENEYCQYGFDSTLVIMNNLPESGIDPDSLVNCVNKTVTFYTDQNLSSVYWTNTNHDTLANGYQFETVVSDTFYYAKFTDQNGCQNIDSVFAESLDIVKPDLGNNRTACIGQSVSVFPFNSSALTAGCTFSWSNGSSDTSVTINNTETLILTVSKGGCSNADTVKITFQNPANFSMGNDTLLCENDSILYDFRGFGESILWNDNATEFTRWITYPGGTYSVEIKSGACVLNDQVTVAFDDLVKPVLPADTAICLGETLTLNANPVGSVYTYNWLNNGVSFSNDPQIVISNEGDHTIVLECATSVCLSSDTMRVVVLSPSALNFPDQHFCETDSAFIDASIPFTGATYVWQDGYQGASRWLKTQGKYVIEITAGPCFIKDSLYVTHDQVPVFSLGADQTICETGSATFTANNTSWQNYIWKDGTTGFSRTENIAGEYILTASNNTCSFSDSVQLFIDTVPVFDLGPDISICENDSVTLTTGITNSNIQHNWNTGSNASSILVKTAGNYSVTATNGLCTYNDNITVATQPLPGVNLGEDQILCLGDQIKVGFNAGAATYNWNTNETTDSITVTQTGNYVLTVTQGLCTESDEIFIQFDQLQKPDLGPDFSQCDQINATLSANTNAQSYEWSRNGTTISENGKTQLINIDGTYVVTAIQGTCTDFDTIEVNIQYAHQVNLSNDSLLCQGESYTIQSTTNAINPSYLWTNGATTDEITVNQSGIYGLQVTDSVCTVNNQVNVVFVPHPYIDLPPGTDICIGDVITIGDFFSSGDTNVTHYQWNTGEDTSIITIGTGGTYIETAAIEHCFDTDYFDLNVVQKPVPNMSPDVVTCITDLQPISTGLPNLQTVWSNGGGVGHTIIARNSGYFVATITDGPCVVQDSVHVLIHPIPDEIVPDLSICPKDSVPISVIDTNLITIWNGKPKTIFMAYPDTKINLELINTFGCKSTQTIHVFKDLFCEDDIFIPNSFSPDGDHINEAFTIFISEHVKLLDFQIFDRWGERIFITRGENKPWDGTWQGKLVTPDVYIWTINYLDQYEKPHKRTGTITVLR